MFWTVYSFSLDENSDYNDDIIEQDGVKVVFDKSLASPLALIEIDFHESDGKRGFVFNDPLKVQGGCSGGSVGVVGGG